MDSRGHARAVIQAVPEGRVSGSIPLHALRHFELVWAAFSRGAIALPQAGMGAIALQLASSLPAGSIRLRAPVTQLDGQQVVLASGEHSLGRCRCAGHRLCYGGDVARRAGTSRTRPSVNDAVFRRPAPPVPGPWLLLNGEQQEAPWDGLCVERGRAGLCPFWAGARFGEPC